MTPVYEFTELGSPSSNVVCYIDVEYLRCDIAEADWSPHCRVPADLLDYGRGSPSSRRQRRICVRRRHSSCARRQPSLLR